MATYRKKPVTVEAVQLLWSTWSEVCDFLEGESAISEENPGYYIDETTGERTDDIKDRFAVKVKTAQGEWVEVKDGEFIIAEGPDYPGRYYPCDAEIFHKTYDAVETGSGWGTG